MTSLPPLTRTVRRTTIRPGRRLYPIRRQRQIFLTVAVGVVLLGMLSVMFVVAAGMTLFMPYGAQEEEAAVDCGPGGSTGEAGTGGAAGAVGSLDEEQMGHAETIVVTGAGLGVDPYGWVIALATALQESYLRNVDHGDLAGPDSRGLFQQRAPWGPYEDRMDPAKATAMFFTGGQAAGTPGLLDIDGWEQMAVTDAAQAVQRSAFPGAYAKHEPLARELVAHFGTDVGGDCGIPPGAMDCPATELPAESGLMPDALLVLRCTIERFPAFETVFGLGDRPSGGDGDHAGGRAVDFMIPSRQGPNGPSQRTGLGDDAARWLQNHHAELGIKYIIWNAEIWSVARADEGWRPYTHYQGCTSATCMHLDHIHVSVFGNAAATGSSGTWTLPIDKGRYTISARYGQSGGRWAARHTGLDFAAPAGTPVRAATGGTVTHAGYSGAFGNLVQIDHGNGITTWYAHLSAFAPGVNGATVTAGTVIGQVGSTGNSTGPHLHFEVRRNGHHTDPETWLQNHGVDP